MRFYDRALDDLLEDGLAEEILDEAATTIRDRARRSAGVISTDRARGIVTETGRDPEGAYADVGYAKNHPGYVLFWHEVGTSQYAATPHLRAAVRPL